MTELLRPKRSAEVVAYAIRFAAAAHGHQVRKYTGDPYLVHPLAVYELVADVWPDVDCCCAAILHDTVEDTHVTVQDIRRAFGPRTARLVDELTDIANYRLPVPPKHGSPYLHGARHRRKRIETMRLMGVSSEAQTIKCADLIDNTRSILAEDRDFARVYLPEARAAYRALTRANPLLRDMLAQQLEV